jgi:hypothetical protein
LSFMATILRASSPARYAPSSAPGAPGTERVWVKPGGCSGTLSATGARTERCGSAALGFCPSFALGLVFRHTVSSSALRLARALVEPIESLISRRAEASGHHRERLRGGSRRASASRSARRGPRGPVVHAVGGGLRVALRTLPHSCTWQTAVLDALRITVLS